MNKTYLQLDFSTGQMFEYSSTAKEGFDKHESTNKKGQTVTSYRKFYKKGVTGILESVSLYDKKMGENTIKQLSLTLKSGDNIYYVPFNLYSQNRSFDVFAESVIKHLPNLQKGTEYTIFPYNFIPEGSSYSSKGVSIKTGETKVEKLSDSYTKKDGESIVGDVPALVYKEDPLDSTKKIVSAVSLELRNDYLSKVLKTQEERLKWVSNTETAASAPPKTESPKAQAPKEESATPSKSDNLDLPF